MFVIRYHTDIPFRCYDLASIPFYCETQFDNSTTNETKLNLITFQCYFMYFSLKNEFYAESVKGGSSIPSVPATGILLATTRLPHTVHTLTDSFEFFFFFSTSPSKPVRLGCQSTNGPVHRRQNRLASGNPTPLSSGNWHSAERNSSAVGTKLHKHESIERTLTESKQNECEQIAFHWPIAETNRGSLHDKPKFYIRPRFMVGHSAKSSNNERKQLPRSDKQQSTRLSNLGWG